MKTGLRGHRRRRATPGEWGVQQTPLIDVVFLILIYFLLTVQPTDLLAHLEVNLPQQVPGPPAVPVLSVELLPGQWMLNGRPMTPDALRGHLVRLGKISSEQSVMILADRRVRHGEVIEALDICAEAGLSRLSLNTLE